MYNPVTYRMMNDCVFICGFGDSEKQGKGLERAIKIMFRADKAVFRIQISGRDTNALGGFAKSIQQASETCVFTRYYKAFAVPEGCSPVGVRRPQR